MRKFFISTLIGSLLLWLLIFVQIWQEYKLLKPSFTIPNIASTGAISFFKSAKKQIWVVTKYDYSNGYYSNGWFPPDDTGVCSDVIWRAYQNMWSNFISLFQKDITKNPELYSKNQDQNINYRRVKELYIYFSRNWTRLTNKLTPNDPENLIQWQTGDIVTFSESWDKNLWHIGIISGIRRKDGVPYMLDNHGNWVDITMTPLDWPGKINGHFRIF
jgi:uncharacterized protein YijF (DUF1287 family)